MARSTMTDIITVTQRLVGQTVASSPWTQDEIQDSLDRWRLHLEWVLLDHDPNYRNYYTRPHHTGSTIFRRRHVETSVPDFSAYTKIGFIESDFSLREDMDEDATAHTPDDSNLNDGTFTFSTPPEVELFFFGKAYDVYGAAADLMLETPDHGRLPLKQWRRLNVSETYGTDEKVKNYRRRSSRLNRRVPRLYRA